MHCKYLLSELTIDGKHPACMLGFPCAYEYGTSKCPMAQKHNEEGKVLRQ